MARAADLVLTMTRAQRRSVLEETPRGLRRTFTLLEAAEALGTDPDAFGYDVPGREAAWEAVNL